MLQVVLVCDPPPDLRYLQLTPSALDAWSPNCISEETKMQPDAQGKHRDQVSPMGDQMQPENARVHTEAT